MENIKKLTEEQVTELRKCKYMPNGDYLFWDKMAEIYSDNQEVLKRIEFEKQYLSSLEAIPYEYPCHWKTLKTYQDTVDDFNNMVGYTSGEKEEEEFEDCLLEKIAEKFGIDIDINGDGMTSFEKYRKKSLET